LLISTVKDVVSLADKLTGALNT